MAKLWNTRPSVLLGVSEPYVAYCLDNSVATFGSALEAELEGVKGKTETEINRKRERLLMKWLDMPLKFKSPAGIASRKKKPEIEQQFTVQGEVV